MLKNVIVKKSNELTAFECEEIKSLVLYRV
jgi:hypothetical protein